MISFCGLNGAGKTTYAKLLAKELDMNIELENLENKYLKLFYENIKDNAFKMEIYALFIKFRKFRTFKGINDKSIDENMIFVEILKKNKILDIRDYNTIKEMFDYYKKNISKTYIYVFVDVSPQTAYNRIIKRNGDFKDKISLEYLGDLYNEYRKFIEDVKKNHIVITINNNDNKNIEQMEKTIKELGNRIKILTL